MNSLQRVLAILKGEPVDRPAFTLLLSLYGARLTGASLRDHYSDPRVYVEGQCAVREAFGTDLLFSPFAIPLMAEAFGSTLQHHATQPPTLARPACASAREALAKAMPEPDGPPALRYLLDSVGLLSKRLAGEAVLVGVMPSPVDLPAMLLGAETWMETLLFDQPAALALLERCAGFCAAFGNAMLAEGATMVAFTANFANPDMLPRKYIEASVLPALQSWTAKIKGPLVFHHGGYRLVPHLDLLKDLPQVVAYVLDVRDNLLEGRLSLGTAPLLLGGLDGSALETFNPETLKQRCHEVLLAQKSDPRFLLASGCADIPLATTPETLYAVRAAVLEAAGVSL